MPILVSMKPWLFKPVGKAKPNYSHRSWPLMSCAKSTPAPDPTKVVYSDVHDFKNYEEAGYGLNQEG